VGLHGAERRYADATVARIAQEALAIGLAGGASIADVAMPAALIVQAMLPTEFRIPKSLTESNEQRWRPSGNARPWRITGVRRHHEQVAAEDQIARDFAVTQCRRTRRRRAVLQNVILRRRDGRRDRLRNGLRARWRRLDGFAANGHGGRLGRAVAHAGGGRRGRSAAGAGGVNGGGAGSGGAVRQVWAGLARAGGEPADCQAGRALPEGGHNPL
jgi:hypothetical protein